MRGKDHENRPVRLLAVIGGLSGADWLELLSLPYARHVVDLLADDQRSAANLARTPQGLVPTMVIDGHDLTQSLAIPEYLDETRGAGWPPGDASQ